MQVFMWLKDSVLRWLMVSIEVCMCRMLNVFGAECVLMPVFNCLRGAVSSFSDFFLLMQSCVGIVNGMVSNCELILRFAGTGLLVINAEFDLFVCCRGFVSSFRGAVPKSKIL